MNILIVDDEKIVINGMMSGINWDIFSFENIYTALNSKQAKEIISNSRVDIIICDIEMPEESGIELLEWIQDNNYNIVSIILTGHANFEYAKKAVELGSINYLLKPATFTEIENQIKKCIKIVHKTQQSNIESVNSVNWKQNSVKRTEQFYFELLSNLQPTKYSQIYNNANKIGVELPAEDQSIFIILFHIHPLVGSNVSWEKSTLYGELKRILQKIFNEFKNVAVPIPENQDLALIVYSQCDIKSCESMLKRDCENYISCCYNHVKHRISAYIGVPCTLVSMRDQLEKLLSTENRFGMIENKIICLSEPQKDFVYDAIDTYRWENYLVHSDIESIYNEVDLYIKEHLNKHNIDRGILNHLLQDFIQVIYSVLNNNGIQAHLLFRDEESSLLQKHAFDSIYSYMKWIKLVLEKSTSCIKTTRQSESVVNILKNYISKNLSKDLSRDNLANYCCLHADYLSRLFKKETGISITEYLIEARMNEAKKLLRETDKSISQIACMVGYTNFSYFTASFQKVEKQSPGNYRKQFKSKEIKNV